MAGNEWLVLYSEEELGPQVVQKNKCCNYREINGHVDAYTAYADVCAKKLREWRRKEPNGFVLDLQKAYLCPNCYGHFNRSFTRNGDTA